MILTLESNKFTETEGVYYSTEFLLEEENLVSVVVWLDEAGTFSMQQSIDGENWADVPDSTVSCNLMGLQVFTDCDYKLHYRIKANQIVTEAKIAI